MGSSITLNGSDPTAISQVPELAQLLLATPTVDEFLHQLAGAAAEFVTPTASCGITLRYDRHPMTVAHSDALAKSLDEVQYGREEGPCLEAMDTHAVVLVADFVDEDRWDGYPRFALANGVRSSLSLPLSADGDAVGALNLYGIHPHTFDDEATIGHAVLFAAQASAVLGVVLGQARQVQLTQQLRTAMRSRSVIDQAIGILMGQEQCGATDAFGLLRTASQHRNRKLRDIAADVITSTTGSPPEPSRFL